jgi:hypothetical protein
MSQTCGWIFCDAKSPSQVALATLASPLAVLATPNLAGCTKKKDSSKDGYFFFLLHVAVIHITLSIIFICYDICMNRALATVVLAMGLDIKQRDQAIFK